MILSTFRRSAGYAAIFSAIITEAHPEFRNEIQHREVKETGVTLPLKATYTPGGTILDVNITIGGQNFSMYLDTGSSDIWVPKNTFQCLNATDNSILPREKCLFNKTYNISSTFQQVPDQNFGVRYGSGIATGVVGNERVTFGGLTVENQTIGVVDKSTDVGDGNDSGVLGLAYPYLTSAHPGTDYANDTVSLWSNRIPYNPLFTNLYQRGLVKPFFSIAVNRTPVNVSNADGGFLSLGTLPPVPHKLTWATAPVEIIKVIPPFFTNNETAKTYWALSVKSTSVNSVFNTTSFQALVDCGNFFNFVPAEVALAVNNAFQPPATRSETFLETGIYDVSCSAVAPTFGLTFDNNVTIYNDLRDTLVENADGTCHSAFVDANILGEASGVVLHILGKPFLQSVVSVFDFGKDEMRFAERVESVEDGNTHFTPGDSGPTTPLIASGGSRLFLTSLPPVIAASTFVLLI